MHLSDYSLRQIDDAYVQSLDVEALRGLSVRLLADLKDARDRLNQGPDNSSRPPSSRAPWDRPGGGPESDAADAADDGPWTRVRASGREAGAGGMAVGRGETGAGPHGPQSRQTTGGARGRPHAGVPSECRTGPLPRRVRRLRPAAGPGGRGGLYRFSGGRSALGRSSATGADAVGSGPSLLRSPLRRWTSDPAVAGQGAVDPLLAGIELSEWRLVGPGLAALIVALALRFRLSRARIREFLGEWLGLKLSIGTIHQTLHEAGGAVAPAEEE